LTPVTERYIENIQTASKVVWLQTSSSFGLIVLYWLVRDVKIHPKR
jgi:hypothetical protein